ncbi:MAG: hypothetical protein WCO19_01895 [Candidatus Saccharibacteria bacterium]
MQKSLFRKGGVVGPRKFDGGDIDVNAIADDVTQLGSTIVGAINASNRPPPPPPPPKSNSNLLLIAGAAVVAFLILRKKG